MVSQNNNVSFQSKLIPTKYLKDLLDAGIKNPVGQSEVVDGIRRIVSDGRDDVVRIDYPKSKFVNWIFPGAYKVSVNDQTRGWNYHFSGGGINVQGRFALEEVYMNEYGQIKLPKVTSIMEESKPTLFRKRIDANWRRLFDEYDYNGADPKKIKNIKKNMEFLKKRYSMVVQEELIKIKKEFFPEG